MSRFENNMISKDPHDFRKSRNKRFASHTRERIPDQRKKWKNDDAPTGAHRLENISDA